MVTLMLALSASPGITMPAGPKDRIWFDSMWGHHPLLGPVPTKTALSSAAKHNAKKLYKGWLALGFSENKAAAFVARAITGEVVPGVAKAGTKFRTVATSGNVSEEYTLDEDVPAWILDEGAFIPLQCGNPSGKPLPVPAATPKPTATPPPDFENIPAPAATPPPATDTPKPPVEASTERSGHKGLYIGGGVTIGFGAIVYCVKGTCFGIKKPHRNNPPAQATPPPVPTPAPKVTPPGLPPGAIK